MNPVSESNIEDIARLKWRCRRGLLELDLVFCQFVETRYPSLDPDMKRAFLSLLNEADNSILAWLHGTEQCTNPDLELIIKKVLEAFEYKDKKVATT